MFMTAMKQQKQYILEKRELGLDFKIKKTDIIMGWYIVLGQSLLATSKTIKRQQQTEGETLSITSCLTMVTSKDPQVNSWQQCKASKAPMTSCHSLDVSQNPLKI